MSEQQKTGFFYGFLALLGVLAPWVWATGMFFLVLDFIVRYLASGREEIIKELIRSEMVKHELEVERLKNRILQLEKQGSIHE